MAIPISSAIFVAGSAESTSAHSESVCWSPPSERPIEIDGIPRTTPAFASVDPVAIGARLDAEVVVHIERRLDERVLRRSSSICAVPPARLRSTCSFDHRTPCAAAARATAESICASRSLSRIGFTLRRSIVNETSSGIALKILPPSSMPTL
jgi:hypothetical protein